MKALYLVTFFLISYTSISAQQIMVEAGNTRSTFEYQNSKGEKMENIYSEDHFNYAVGYRMTLSEKFYLSGQILWNRYAAYASDPVYDNYYRWDTHYLGIGVGLDFEFIQLNKFKFLIRAAAEPQFLIRGTQSINNQVYDLKGKEQFDNPFVFAKGGLGVNYCADANITIVARYYYGYSFPLGSSDDAEKFNIISNSFNIGLMISLKNCKYCYTKHF